ENRLDLGERETQVFQRDDPVQTGKLMRFVQAVPGHRIDVRRTQQAERVVTPQHAHRHPADTGELPDTEHASGLSPDTLSGSSPWWLDSQLTGSTYGEFPGD